MSYFEESFFEDDEDELNVSSSPQNDNVAMKLGSPMTTGKSPLKRSKLKLVLS